MKSLAVIQLRWFRTLRAEGSDVVEWDLDGAVALADVAEFKLVGFADVVA